MIESGMRLDGLLEDLARRWEVPHCPEFELGLYRRLRAAELRAALSTLARASSAVELARRGRLRRLLGDTGAANDYRAALDLAPRLARAHAWLGEVGMGEHGARESLDRAVALAPGDGWCRVYRGAARLLEADARGAAEDLERATEALPREALAVFLLGVARSRRRRRRSADAAFAKTLALQPACSAAALLRGRLWSGSRAAKITEDALDADPDHAHVALFTWEPERSWGSWLSRHGDFCLAEGRELHLCARFGLDETRFSPYPEEAVARARRALDVRGARAWTLAVYGRALARVPGADAAARRQSRRLLDAAVAANPGAGWTWAWRALSRVGEEPERALADLNRALRLSPHYFRAYSWRGSVLRRLGRLRESLSDLDRSAAGDERYPFSAHERSLTRRALGDALGAALDLDRAYVLDNRYSWVYAAGREPSAAERDRGLSELTRALARHPSCASLHAWRGELLWRSGRLGEAVLALRDAAALDPAHALGQGFLGAVLVEAGRPEDAIEPLRRAVALDARILAFRWHLAEALRGAGYREDAEALLKQTLRERPKAWILRLQRARWRLADGHASAALREARAAAALEGRDAEGWFLEARALAELGRSEGAEAAVDRALAIAPNLGRAWLLRAQVRQSRGRAAAAIDDFRVVHERFPYLFNEQERERVAALLEAK